MHIKSSELHRRQDRPTKIWPDGGLSGCLPLWNSMPNSPKRMPDEDTRQLLLQTGYDLLMSATVHGDFDISSLTSLPRPTAQRVRPIRSGIRRTTTAAISRSLWPKPLSTQTPVPLAN